MASRLQIAWLSADLIRMLVSETHSSAPSFSSITLQPIMYAWSLFLYSVLARIKCLSFARSKDVRLKQTRVKKPSKTNRSGQGLDQYTRQLQ